MPSSPDSFRWTLRSFPPAGKLTADSGNAYTVKLSFEEIGEIKPFTRGLPRQFSSGFGFVSVGSRSRFLYTVCTNTKEGKTQEKHQRTDEPMASLQEVLEESSNSIIEQVTPVTKTHCHKNHIKIFAMAKNLCKLLVRYPVGVGYTRGEVTDALDYYSVQMGHNSIWKAHYNC